MKLFATLETSKGKIVSISDNSQIIATVYDRNLKAYSVIIEWCDVGDIIDDEGNDLTEKQKTKGAILTVKEWRNVEDKLRKSHKLQGKKDVWVCPKGCEYPYGTEPTCEH